MSQPTDPARLETPASPRLGRRAMIAGSAAALVGAFALNGTARADAAVGPPPREYPFTLGVASGDPLPDSVVLWTRLAPERFAPFGGMDGRDRRVVWEVAADPGFVRVVRTGVALAEAQFDHTVHVDVRGLRPWREYFYRFRAGRHESPVGRTKTAPAPGAHLDQLDIAVASCQSYGGGLYHAWAEIAGESPDLVLFLGDYIYEYQFAASAHRPRPADLPSDFDRPTDTLSRYRLQHTLYKTDPNLAEAHRTSPFAVTWDDHEVWNDYWDEHLSGSTPEQVLARRASAYRAFWEYLPLRAPRPSGPDLQLYRRLAYGDLATFNLADVRQYSSPPLGTASTIPESPARRDPARSVLGFEQERWLLDGLGASTTRWDVLAQGILFSQLDTGAGDLRQFSAGSWAAFQASQQRVIDTVIERQVDGFVVLTGDVHRNYDLDILANFDDPASRVVGVEFAGTSISSGGDGRDTDAGVELRLAENPHLKFANLQRGYLRCRIDHDQWRTDLMVLDKVTTPTYTLSTRASFMTEAGNPGLQRV